MQKDQDSPAPSVNLSLRHILQRHEEQLMDFDKNICLLCKRMFKNADQIRRHASLSKLHSSRLVRLRQRLFSEDQLDRIERKEREAMYRDRAKERRLKYGQTDRTIPLEPRLPSLIKTPAPAAPKTTEPLSSDNKGAVLMSKMGWREGTGLGRTNEGRLDIVKLEPNAGTSGLGTSNLGANLSYKEAVKRVMYERYRELSSDDNERQ